MGGPSLYRCKAVLVYLGVPQLPRCKEWESFPSIVGDFWSFEQGLLLAWVQILTLSRL